MDKTNSSANVWYIIGAVVVIAALAFWYFSTTRAPSTTGTETSGDTTAAAISAELNQISDDSGTLEQDASASAAAVGSL